MKFIIRSFFRTLRIVLGPFMQVWEFVTRPKGVVRAPELQQTVNLKFPPKKTEFPQ